MKAAYLALAASLAAGVSAEAQEMRQVFVPMTFPAEAAPIRTSACLQVDERLYGSASWWEKQAAVAGSKRTPQEQAFQAVIAAIRAKDRASLVKLSDPAQVKDANRFDKQVEALFSQFDKIVITAVPRAYEFSGLVVFVPRFQVGKNTLDVPFVFAARPNGGFVYLPFRSEATAYVLLRDWLNAPWGPGKTETPAYCDAATVKRATHAVNLESEGAAAAGEPMASRGSLLLTGAPLDAPGSLSALAERIKSTIAVMKDAVTRIEEFAKFLTPEGAAQVLKWHPTATDTERAVYRDAIVNQTPFFIFDALPLVVVYTRTFTGVQVMYFTERAGGQLLWTNSAHVTAIDALFKRPTSLLMQAAKLEVPFSSLRLSPK